MGAYGPKLLRCFPAAIEELGTCSWRICHGLRHGRSAYTQAIQEILQLRPRVLKVVTIAGNVLLEIDPSDHRYRWADISGITNRFARQSLRLVATEC